MTQTSTRPTPEPGRQPGGQARPGAEYGEAGDPGDALAGQDGRAIGTLQAHGAAQGQVSGRTRNAGASGAPQAMRPPVDIHEDEGGVTLLADMPGVSRERLEVRVDGDTLIIEGRADVPEVGEMELLHGELLSPLYRRSFTLSRDLDPQRIEASLTHGVLRLRIHKAEQAQPRRIEVQAG